MNEVYYFPGGKWTLSGIGAAANNTDVVICGVMSHMCVDAATRASNDLGHACTVVHDARTSATWSSTASPSLPPWDTPRSYRQAIRLRQVVLFSGKTVRVTGPLSWRDYRGRNGLAEVDDLAQLEVVK